MTVPTIPHIIGPRSVRRTSAFVVGFAFVVAACSGSDASRPQTEADAAPTAPSTSPATPAEVSPDRSTSIPASSAPTSTIESRSVEVDPSFDEFVEALAAAGITVVEAPDGVVVAPAVQPAGAIQVTRVQAAALARDARLGVGLTAAELDDLLGEPLPGVSMSSIIAGYATAADTPGGQWSQGLLGPVDGAFAPEARVPGAVLLLFAAEATRPTVDDAEPISGMRLGAAGAVRPAPARIPGSELGCALFGGWVSAMLTTLFDFTSVNALTWMPPWITAGGLSLVRAELVDLMAASLPALAIALFTVATVTMVASVLGSWSVAVTAQSATDRFAVGSEPDRANSFAAAVTGALAWPPYLDECAAQLGVVLPDPSGAGSPVTWEVTGLPQFGTEQHRDDVFDAAGGARLDWITGREASDTGNVRTGTVTATALLDPDLRTALLELANQGVQTVINASAPHLVAGLPVVLPEILPVIAAATELTTQLASEEVLVTYHSEACRTGTWSSVDYLADGLEIAGGVGTMRLQFTDEEHGTATFDPSIPVYSRVIDPEAPPVRLDISGGFTFRVDANGTNGVLESGQGLITVYADLGSGWILAGEPEPFPGPGDMFITSVFECNGDSLVLRGGARGRLGVRPRGVSRVDRASNRS